MNKFKKYPFFIIVDDGGFEYAVYNDEKSKIDMGTYYTILKIAKEFEIKIPVCFTMKYLDKENISGVGEPLEYLDELINFLKNNSQYIEIGYHGLTHEYEERIGEFFSLNKNEPVPEETQRNHVEKSKRIFNYWGLKFPELFVPPYHAWQEGVTDKILLEYGIKYLISQQENIYNGFRYRYMGSKYLIFLPRADLGVYSRDYSLDKNSYRKSKFFGKEKIGDYVRKHIIPRDFFTKVRLNGFLRQDRPVHSYVTHIGNFTPSCYNFWRELFSWVKKNKKLHLCKDNYEAIRLFLELR